GNEHMGYRGRQFAYDGGPELVIQHIAFADCDDKTFMQQFGIVFFEFVDEDVEFFRMVGTIGRYQEQQDGVSLDMSQESMPKTFPFRRSFDDPGQIGYAK